MSPVTLEDHLVEIAEIDRKINQTSTRLLGLKNERRDLTLSARKLELEQWGKLEDRAFKLRYHHAVQDVKEAVSELNAAKAAAKAASETHVEYLEALTKLEEKSQQQLEEEEAVEREKSLPIIKLDSAEKDAWRSLPLSTLNLSQAILAKLAEPVLKKSDKKLGEVTTLGGLVDITSSGLAYSQLKGISSTTSGKIEDAWMEFWKNNPQPAEPAEIVGADLAKSADLAVSPGSPDPEHQIEELIKHGLKSITVTALQERGYRTVEALTDIIQDDDLLADVVGKKAVKNVRLAHQSLGAMQS